MAFKVPEVYRVKRGPAPHQPGDNFGVFMMPSLTDQQTHLRIIASAGVENSQFSWEHVSVSTSRARTPTWAEMCQVKDLFWDEEDCVVQYHPPRSDYVNHHPYVLHLWRPIGVTLPRPPSIMVGPLKP